MGWLDVYARPSVWGYERELPDDYDFDVDRDYDDSYTDELDRRLLRGEYDDVIEGS